MSFSLWKCVFGLEVWWFFFKDTTILKHNQHPLKVKNTYFLWKSHKKKKLITFSIQTPHNQSTNNLAILIFGINSSNQTRYYNYALDGLGENIYAKSPNSCPPAKCTVHGQRPGTKLSFVARRKETAGILVPGQNSSTFLTNILPIDCSMWNETIKTWNAWRKTN